MGFNAQKLVRKLQRRKRPHEVKLTPNTWRVLDYLALCANEDDAAANDGHYIAYPAEKRILFELDIGHGTLYRAFNQLEFGGLYLIARGNCNDSREALYDLYLQPSELTPEAIQARTQSAEARLSAAPDGRGVRKRNTSQNGTYLPGITSQNGTYSDVNHVPERDVITSQNGTETPQITSQNGTQYLEGICTTRNLNQERGEERSRSRASAPAPDPPRTKNTKIPKIVATVIEKHAAWWEAIVSCAVFREDGAFDRYRKSSPEAEELMNAGIVHVGGWIRFQGFKAHPRNADFARNEFLAFMSRNDPAYEAAVGAAVAESLDDKPVRPPKANAASRSP